RLKELLAEEKKDDGLVFDELGIDQLFVDEAQAFKNLETPTKMERVAGIQTGGSERAFDLFMKTRYLDKLHPGHGVCFASGTPITIACPMSQEQCDLQSDLVARYDRLRNGKVDPREDNALAITTDGRKLALNAQLLSATAPDCPDSKINALVENVADIWQRT